MARSLVGIVLVILLGYGVVKAWPLISGPELRIESPTAYTSLPDGNITISGVALHTENLSLNGAPLLIDTGGRFAKNLYLPSGGAILTLTATDRFGRSVTEQRTVYVP